MQIIVHYEFKKFGVNAVQMLYLERTIYWENDFCAPSIFFANKDSHKKNIVSLFEELLNGIYLYTTIKMLIK